LAELLESFSLSGVDSKNRAEVGHFDFTTGGAGAIRLEPGAYRQERSTDSALVSDPEPGSSTPVGGFVMLKERLRQEATGSGNAYQSADFRLRLLWLNQAARRDRPAPIQNSYGNSRVGWRQWRTCSSSGLRTCKRNGNG